MEKTKLKKNPNGDTRTATLSVDYEGFKEANRSHIKDVDAVMSRLSNTLYCNGVKHDWTKIAYEEEFWNCFYSALTLGTNFVDDVWYQRHIDYEKHHPTSKMHEDTNLLDIIEMIVDCVCAGMTRSGEVNIPEVSDEILRKAFNNMVDYVTEMVEVEE